MLELGNEGRPARTSIPSPVDQAECRAVIHKKDGVTTEVTRKATVAAQLPESAESPDRATTPRAAGSARTRQRSADEHPQDRIKPDLHERTEAMVARGGVEPPTFRFSVGRSYQLSYLAVLDIGGPDGT